jgi:hypothetical protein
LGGSTARQAINARDHQHVPLASRARELLVRPLLPIEAIKAASTSANEPQMPKQPCPCCGGCMIIIETFQRGCSPRYHPTAPAPAISVPKFP